MNGRPLDLRWAAEHVPAILDVWYPGTQGGTAVANLLLGDVSPGGKLPFTWPRTVGQVPMIYSHTTSHEPENQRTALLGRGEHAAVPVRPRAQLLALRVRRRVDRDRSGASVTVSVDVTNAGDREADEVVQLYIHQRHGTASRPVRELKGFERITLAPGETRTVRFTLGPASCATGTRPRATGSLDASTFDVWVGGDSTAERSGTFVRSR